jgi:hypothetical protein
VFEGIDFCSELFFDHGSDGFDRIIDFEDTIDDRLIIVLDSKDHIQSDSCLYIIFGDTIDRDIEIHQSE